MKKLLVLLFLVGCDSSGYRVYMEQQNICTNQTMFVCERVINGFKNQTMAFCDSKEQCNAICDKLRRRELNIKDQ
jgi:superfamily II helicase